MCLIEGSGGWIRGLDTVLAGWDRLLFLLSYYYELTAGSFIKGIQIHANNSSKPISTKRSSTSCSTSEVDPQPLHIDTHRVQNPTKLP